MITNLLHRPRLSSFAATLLYLLAVGTVSAETLKPSTDYRPQDVVSIIVEALRTNSPSTGDEGIATVFNFASPANRNQTGPLPRFTNMLKTGYGDMLNHLANRSDPMQVDGNVAMQAVWLTTTAGTETGYVFRLRKQPDGEFSGMWMTDAVYPVGPGEEGQAI